MAHKLIAILGTGQLGRKNYENVAYSYKSKKFETPFVVDAIFNITDIKYDEIYILGTTGSQWQNLYDYFTSQDESEEKYNFFDKIDSKIGNARADENTNDPINSGEIEYIELAAKKYFNVTVRLKIIPFAKEEGEIWKLFETILTIPNIGDAISVDLTHGFRYQPVILALGLNYFKIMKDIEIKGVFYGCLDNKNKTADILDIHPIFEMIEWINAASSFKKYFDIKPLASLLKDAPEAAGFIKLAEEFSNTFVLNASNNISSLSKKFVYEIGTKTVTTIEPFNFIKNDILEFPQKLNKTNSIWDSKLKIANHYVKNGQLGFAIINLFEAVMDRIANILNISIRGKNEFKNNYMPILKNLREINLLTSNLNPETKNLIKAAKELNEYRNSIAHGQSLQYSKLINRLPELIDTINNNINSSKLEELKSFL